MGFFHAGSDTSDSASDGLLEVTGVFAPAGSQLVIATNHVWTGSAGQPPPPHAHEASFAGVTIPPLVDTIGVPDPSAPAEGMNLYALTLAVDTVGDARWVVTGTRPECKNMIVTVVTGYAMEPLLEGGTPLSGGGVTEDLLMSGDAPAVLPAAALCWAHHCGPVTDAAGTWVGMTAGPRAGTAVTSDESDATLDVAVLELVAPGFFEANKLGFTARAMVGAGLLYSKVPDPLLEFRRQLRRPNRRPLLQRVLSWMPPEIVPDGPEPPPTPRLGRGLSPFVIHEIRAGTGINLEEPRPIPQAPNDWDPGEFNLKGE